MNFIREFTMADLFWLSGNACSFDTASLVVSIRRPLLFRLITSIRTILFQTLNRLHCLPITPMCATTRHTDSVCSPLTSQAMVKGKQLRALMFQFPNSLAKINWRYRVNLKSASAVGVTVILRRVLLSETGEC